MFGVLGMWEHLGLQALTLRLDGFKAYGGFQWQKVSMGSGPPQ